VGRDGFPVNGSTRIGGAGLVKEAEAAQDRMKHRGVYGFRNGAANETPRSALMKSAVRKRRYCSTDL
jgi:hypothetical protein